MKIIFLDVDGVLNSLSYYERSGGQEQIDPFNVAMLKALVDASQAEIVLTSSWRDGWSSGSESAESRRGGKQAAGNRCGEEGRILNLALSQYGLSIMDKTGHVSCPLQETRCREILGWLKKAPEPVESFVILDDADYDWEKYGLAPFLVHTDFEKDGLTVRHLPKAMEILKEPPVSLKKLLFFNWVKGNLR